MSYLTGKGLLNPSLKSPISNVVTILKRNRYQIPVRKKIWEPTAKSKLFVIPQVKPVPKDEAHQFRLLEIRQNTFLKSLKVYCEQNFYLPTITAGGYTKEQVQAELDEQRRLLEENEVENARVAAAREVRLAQEDEMTKEYLLRKQVEEQEKIALEREKASEKIKLETKRATTFITLETLEQAIEDALKHPVDYEYAIDTGGNIYFDGKLHPYALRPADVPETSSVTEEFEKMEKENRYKLEPTSLYH